MSLQKLKGLSDARQRCAAAILGALVADAAAAPLHWIYDQDKVAQLIKDNGSAEFYPTSQCPFYTIPTGNNSTYGDQLYVTLKNMAENKGFDANKLADALFGFFGPGTEYEKARVQSQTPKKGPWTNHCIRILIANRENGDSPAADTKTVDPDGLCKAIALVGQGKLESFEATIKACVNTCQLNPVAVDFAVGGLRILKNITETGKLNKDIDLPANVAAAIEAANKNKNPHPVAVKELGIACAFPGSFQSAAHGLLNNCSGYANAVREEIRAGGDNCSRIIFVGACAAALNGLDSIPEEWLKKYNKSEEVIGYIETVMSI